MTCLLCPKLRPKIPGGGVLPEKLGGVCGTLPETLTLLRTKICEFPYPISHLIKILIPYFRPEALEPRAWPERVTSCYSTFKVVGVNVKREMVLWSNDEKVANSSKKHTHFKTLFQTKMVEIDTRFQTKIPFGAAHTYISYTRDYPPVRKTCCRLWVSLLTQARLKTKNALKLP